MLKDRRVLLEHEIKKLQTEAANMYLGMVISGHDLHNTEYQSLKNRIADLKFDLQSVDKLMSDGHE